MTYQPPGTQAASAAQTLIRASKTFTGAANLGATGVNELFTTTGAVAIDGFWVRCTTTLVDAVDGAEFSIGLTDEAATWADFAEIDLDIVVAGSGLEYDGIKNGWGKNLLYTDSTMTPIMIVDNIIMTISGQAITGGVLAFYILYRPLSADGALTLGAGMVAV